MPKYLSEVAAEPLLVVQLVVSGNVHDLGWVEDRAAALKKLGALPPDAFESLTAGADEDKYLILNVLPPLGIDRASLDFEVEVLFCTICGGTNDSGDVTYRWVDGTGVLPAHIRAQLRLQ